MTPLTLDTIVELCDQYTDVYPRSPTGARGWVRARREMPKSDPEIYIEWDKHHWRYEGERDGWTYEHHFRPVDDSLPDLRDAIDGPLDMNEILASAHRQVDAERCPECGDFHDQPAAFLDTLVDAQEAALGSDGYLIITLTPHTDGDLTIYEPQIYSEVLTPAAQGMIEAQLLHLATQLFEEHMLTRVSGLVDGVDSSDSSDGLDDSGR